MFWLVKSLAYDVVFTIDSQLVRSGHWNLIFAILALLTFRWWVHLWMKWTMIKQRCTQDKFIYSYVFLWKLQLHVCIQMNICICWVPYVLVHDLIYSSWYSPLKVIPKQVFVKGKVNIHQCSLHLWQMSNVSYSFEKLLKLIQSIN